MLELESGKEGCLDENESILFVFTHVSRVLCEYTNAIRLCLSAV